MIPVSFNPSSLDKSVHEKWWTDWNSSAEKATEKAIDAFEDWLLKRPGTPFSFEFDSDVWKELKNWLLKNVFYQKCAYCEREISGYYGDAEHYRPKRRR